MLSVGIAQAADLAPLFTKAPPPAYALPAVDSLNFKADGFGGSIASRSV